jgi:hypothetical protein
VFGIYPGGVAGTIGPTMRPAPENATKRLAALERLKPADAPFVLHLYAGYTGSSGPSAAAQIGRQIARYSAKGFDIELVLRYSPADLNTDVSGFARFVRGAVRSLGRNPHFVSLQVTNEANRDQAPSASDGYYPGAEDALIEGVIAAQIQRDREHVGQLKVGFNWAYGVGSSEPAFWRYLRQAGGQRFLRAVDWVGVNAYPGTWGPPLRRGVTLAAGIRIATIRALSTMRHRFMRLAGIPSSVPIHITESGYPTGPGRSDRDQAAALRAVVRTVYAYRTRDNISDYCWFDLRDDDSDVSNFQAQYGLMTDTYAPKPAFDVYRSLVASLATR